MRKERSSNLEILRIVCMFMVVMSHFVGHGGSALMDGMTVNRIISLLVSPFGKICFDCFVALSTWFLVKSTFKAERFVKIWLQVLFYNLVFLALTCLLGGQYTYGITRYTWMGAFFPMIGNSHGFAAAYLAFYLTIPFLRLVSESVNKRQLAFLIGILLVTQSGVQIIGQIVEYTQPLASEILLFVLCYYISDYLHRFPSRWQSNVPVLVAVLLCEWFVTFLCWMLFSIYPEMRKTYILAMITGSEFFIGNVIAGYALFFLFDAIKIPVNRMINAAASTMFGVLLAHDHNYFRMVLWRVILKTDQWYYIPTASFVGRMIAVVVFVMLAGMILEALRQMIIERPVLKSKPFAMVCKFLDGCVPGGAQNG